MSNLVFSKITIQALVLIILLICNASYITAKTVVGWVETIRVTSNGYKMDAKIDTGADTSSINVLKTSRYIKHGRQWVKFIIVTKAGKQIVANKKIVRFTRVKLKQSGFQRRIVVTMRLCLGSLSKVTEVNLVDRSQFKYQVLLGRSFLRNDYLVDAGQQYKVTSKCQN